MLIKCGLILTVAILSPVASYQQKDYNLTSERLEVVSQDNNLVVVNVKNFKYNRTAKAVNLTAIFKVDFGYSVTVAVQAYKFLSNEYRPFPMTFDRNACTTLDSNEFGMDTLLRCGNFTKCPLKKGHYQICNWIPDGSKFPPYIPSGDYRLDIKFINCSKEFAHYQWYLKFVKRFFYN